MSHHDQSSDVANPVKLVVFVFLGLIALVIGILMLAYYAVGGYTVGETNAKANTPEQVAKRIAPVVSLAVDPSKAPAQGLIPVAAKPAMTAAPAIVAAAIPAAAPAGAAKVAGGEGIYASACAACHAAGIAGAPKSGDKAAWAPRIATGKDTLYTRAISGFQGKAGVMPAKGGHSALTDADVKSAVDYMIALAK